MTGRIAGTRIEIGWSWLAVLPVVGIALFASIPGDAPQAARVGAAAAGSMLLLASVIVHEAGHVVVARRRDVEVERVAVLLLGGYSEMDLESAGPATERAVALAGPVVSAFAGVVLWSVAFLLDAGWFPDPSNPQARVLTVLALVNFGVAVFNLLPAFPLDGGRVVRAVLVARGVPRPTAERHAIRVGAAVGAGFVVAGVIASVMGSPAALVAVPVGVMVLALAFVSAREQPDAKAQGI